MSVKYYWRNWPTSQVQSTNFQSLEKYQSMEPQEKTFSVALGFGVQDKWSLWKFQVLISKLAFAWHISCTRHRLNLKKRIIGIQVYFVWKREPKNSREYSKKFKTWKVNTLWSERFRFGVLFHSHLRPVIILIIGVFARGLFYKWNDLNNTEQHVNKNLTCTLCYNWHHNRNILRISMVTTNNLFLLGKKRFHHIRYKKCTLLRG